MILKKKSFGKLSRFVCFPCLLGNYVKSYMGLSSCCISFIGRLFVKITGKPIEILSELNKMAGYAPDEEIDLYEV